MAAHQSTPAPRPQTPPPQTPPTRAASTKAAKQTQPGVPHPLGDFPENLLRVRPWHDPILEDRGHDPRSLYVERYWLPVLGPSATLLLRRLATELEVSPEGFDLTCADWARELGIGMRGGKHGPFWRALDRTCRFGATKRSDALLLVRPKLMPLTINQVMRLPQHLQAAHHVWTVRQLPQISSKDPSAA